METRTHVHEEEFDVSVDRMFEILHTPSAICKWWNASRAIVLAQNDGFWSAAWGDQDSPDYITSFLVKEFDPPNRMLLTDSRYFSKDGELPFEADMTTEFTVERKGPNKCVLRVSQDGFPADAIADEYYKSCDTGWRDTFASIRKYLSE